MNEIDEIIKAAKDLVKYFAYNSKNTTKAQDEKIIILADALLRYKDDNGENEKWKTK